MASALNVCVKLCRMQRKGKGKSLKALSTLRARGNPALISNTWQSLTIYCRGLNSISITCMMNPWKAMHQYWATWKKLILKNIMAIWFMPLKKTWVCYYAILLHTGHMITDCILCALLTHCRDNISAFLSDNISKATFFIIFLPTESDLAFFDEEHVLVCISRKRIVKIG